MQFSFSFAQNHLCVSGWLGGSGEGGGGEKGGGGEGGGGDKTGGGFDGEKCTASAGQGALLFACMAPVNPSGI